MAVKIPIAVPSFGPGELEAVVAPLRSGWVAQGPQVAALEAAFARYMHIPHALTCSNGTAALHLALAALGIGPGDEVIVPGFTWIATANVVELLGARAVLCDIDPDTFLVGPEHIAPHITPRTRAIMPVHLFGAVADMPALMDLARAHDLHVIEDAACAVGSWHGDVHAGGFGDFGTFSFHPRKVLTCGEGGLIYTSNPDLAARVASLRNHGAEGFCPPPSVDPALTQDRAALFEAHPGAGAYVLGDHPRPGFNYRLTDIQAAILNVQLARLPELIAARTHLADRYNAAFAQAHLPVRLPSAPPNTTHAWQAYVLRLLPTAPLSRDQLADTLALQGIQTRQGTHALHLLGYYRDTYKLAPDALPGCLDAHRNSLALPLYPDLSEALQDEVIAAVIAAFGA